MRHMKTFWWGLLQYEITTYNNQMLTHRSVCCFLNLTLTKEHSYIPLYVLTPYFVLSPHTNTSALDSFHWLTRSMLSSLPDLSHRDICDRNVIHCAPQAISANSLSFRPCISACPLEMYPKHTHGYRENHKPSIRTHTVCVLTPPHVRVQGAAGDWKSGTEILRSPPSLVQDVEYR